jgi:uncharacterized protein (TIGR02231 family)
MSAIAAELPVVEVVVLEDRARVTRRGTVQLPAGQSRVRVSGVAPVLVDKSAIARAPAGAAGAAVDIIDVRVGREVAPWLDGAADARVQAEALVALRVRRDAARDAARAVADEAAAAAATAALLDELTTVAGQELAGEAAWGRTAAGAAERIAELATRARAAAARAATLAVDVARAREEVVRLEQQVAVRERDLGRELAALSIDVVAAAAGACELIVEYTTPCACWRPYHTATLRGDAVELTTDACVWQATGEDWREVRLRFSTERPSLGTSPPDLHDDLLRVQPKGALVVTAREQEIATTGEGAAKKEAVELPGVDDGGVTRILAAPMAASVPSDGRPYRVRIGGFTTKAERALVAMPEKAAAAILRTRHENASPEPLLAGPVDLVREGGLCGRTSILYVAPGERFLLGWGPEPSVRINRTHREKREESGMLGSWSSTTHRVAVRLSNLGGAVRKVVVTERIPVAEVEQVEVKLGAPETWKLEDDDGERRDKTPLALERSVDATDGLVTWTVELPPRSHRAIALEYLVRTHDSVTER